MSGYTKPIDAIFSQKTTDTSATRGLNDLARTRSVRPSDVEQPRVGVLRSQASNNYNVSPASKTPTRIAVETSQSTATTTPSPARRQIRSRRRLTATTECPQTVQTATPISLANSVNAITTPDVQHLDAGIGQGLGGEHISLAHLVTPETASTCASVAAGSPVADFDSPLSQRVFEPTPAETQLVPYTATEAFTDLVVHDHEQQSGLVITDQSQADLVITDQTQADLVITDQSQADLVITDQLQAQHTSMEYALELTAFEAEAQAAAFAQGLLQQSELPPSLPSKAEPFNASVLVDKALNKARISHDNSAVKSISGTFSYSGLLIGVIAVFVMMGAGISWSAYGSSTAVSPPVTEAPFQPLEAETEDTKLPWAKPSIEEYHTLRSTAERYLISQIPLTGLAMRIEENHNIDDSAQASVWMSLASAPPLNSRFSRMCLTVQGSDAVAEEVFVTGCLQGEAVFVAQGIARRLSVRSQLEHSGWESDTDSYSTSSRWGRDVNGPEVQSFGISGLPAGMYRVTSTLMDARGQKHSAVQQLRIKLPNGGGGAVTGSEQGAIVKPVVKASFARTVGGGIAAV